MTTDSFLKSSFDTLLSFHEVIQYNKFVMALADIRAAIPADERQVGFPYGTAGEVVLGGQ